MVWAPGPPVLQLYYLVRARRPWKDPWKPAAYVRIGGVRAGRSSANGALSVPAKHPGCRVDAQAQGPAPRQRESC